MFHPDILLEAFKFLERLRLLDLQPVSRRWNKTIEDAIEENTSMAPQKMQYLSISVGSKEWALDLVSEMRLHFEFDENGSLRLENKWQDIPEFTHCCDHLKQQTNSLIGRNIFPYGAESVVFIQMDSRRKIIYFTCYNKLTADSAFNLFHILSHINGVAFESFSFSTSDIELLPSSSDVSIHSFRSIFPAENPFKIYASRCEIETPAFLTHQWKFLCRSVQAQRINWSNCDFDEGQTMEELLELISQGGGPLTRIQTYFTDFDVTAFVQHFLETKGDLRRCIPQVIITFSCQNPVSRHMFYLRSKAKETPTSGSANFNLQNTSAGKLHHHTTFKFENLHSKRRFTVAIIDKIRGDGSEKEMCGLKFELV